MAKDKGDPSPLHNPVSPGYNRRPMRRILATLLPLLFIGCSEQPPALEAAPEPTGQLHPGYPSVEGRCQMTKRWSIELPGSFNRRIEDDSLVFWRPKLTIWTNVWTNGGEYESAAQRVEQIRAETSADAFDLKVESSEGLERLSFRLKEGAESGGQAGFYCFAISDLDYVQMAIYFDDPKDEEAARAILRSLAVTPR